MSESTRWRESAALVAARDQALAWTRDLAATGMPVLLLDLPRAGEKCCWCNCPHSAPERETCQGCTAQADVVLRIYPEPEPGDNWPVCQAHREDALTVAQVFMASRAVPD